MRNIRDQIRLSELLSKVTEDNKHEELITDCVCGNTDPHEPWWEDCDLGQNEEFARAVVLTPKEEEELMDWLDDIQEKGYDHYTQEDC